MSKLDLIKEAENKLKDEQLEKEKQKILSEVRFIETRLKNKLEYIENQEKEVEAAKKDLEKEQKAADAYKETGDYEAYKKELDIKDCTYGTIALGSGISSIRSDFTWTNNNSQYLTGSGTWIVQ